MIGVERSVPIVSRLTQRCRVRRRRHRPRRVPRCYPCEHVPTRVPTRIWKGSDGFRWNPQEWERTDSLDNQEILVRPPRLELGTPGLEGPPSVSSKKWPTFADLAPGNGYI